MASLINKAKEMVGGSSAENNHHHTEPHTETHTETVKTGPVHNNEALNKVDPRVHEHKTTTTTSYVFSTQLK